MLERARLLRFQILEKSRPLRFVIGQHHILHAPVHA